MHYIYHIIYIMYAYYTYILYSVFISLYNDEYPSILKLLLQVISCYN